MMFSYGTSLLAFLEWRNSASLPVLLLPFVCAAIGIVVATMCLRKGATERIDLFEAVAFTTDLWLTIIYAYFAFGFGDVSRYVAFFLIVTNLTTISRFTPLIRSTWNSPASPLMQRVWAQRRVKPSLETAFPQLGASLRTLPIPTPPFAPVRRKRAPSTSPRKARTRVAVR
jgi:hypothetical protein